MSCLFALPKVLLKSTSIFYKLFVMSKTTFLSFGSGDHEQAQVRKIMSLMLIDLESQTVFLIFALHKVCILFCV